MDENRQTAPATPRKIEHIYVDKLSEIYNLEKESKKYKNTSENLKED